MPAARMQTIINGLRDTVNRQQEEMEYMRVSMFWEVQGPIAMQAAMAKMNARITKCRCASCYMVGRANVVSKRKNAECKFVPFFEDCVKALDMVAMQQPTPPFKRPEAGDDAVLQLRALCVEAECHLVEVVEYARGEALRWADFKYGALIWRAKREDDQEVRKLVQLIAVLSGIVGPVADEASDEEASDEEASDEASDEDDDITEVASNDAKKGSDEAEEDDEADETDEAGEADEPDEAGEAVEPDGQ